MNAQEFQVLQGLSAGVNNSQQNVAPVVIAQSNPIAPLTPEVRATNPTVNISPEAMVGNVCGMFALDIVTEDVGDTLLVLGQGDTAGGPGQEAVLRQLFGLSSLPFASNTPGVTVTPARAGIPLPAGDFLAWFNEYLCCNNMIVGNIAVTDTGSVDPAGFARFRKSALRISSVSPSGNFSQSNYALKPDLCNPCFNASDDIGLWETKAPLSDTTGISIVLPPNLSIQLEFEVVGTANTGAFASC